MLNSGVQRLHPLLPTSEEAKQNPTQVYSDHLPVLFEVPVPTADRAHAKLKIVSWNIMKSNNPSGFHAKWGEWAEEAKERHRRIAAALRKFADHNQADVIVLQEANLSMFHQETLDNLFPKEEWEIIESDENQTGNLILCRTKTLIPDPDTYENSNCCLYQDHGMGYRQRQLFQINGTDWQLDLMNVDSRSDNEIPKEEAYRSWLQEATDHICFCHYWRNQYACSTTDNKSNEYYDWNGTSIFR